MDSRQIKGISSQILFTKILDAIDKGATTNEIRQNPLKYLVSGKTKEIVINSGGEGLKVSREILAEMARQGDLLAKRILEKDNFEEIPHRGTKSSNTFANQWAYLESQYKIYDRENPILIKILKEDRLKNIGGWELIICRVYVEPWSYKIIKSDDLWGSEFVEGTIDDDSL